MGIILSYILIGFATVTLGHAAGILHKMRGLEKDGVLFSCFAVASAVWSIGFGVLIIQSNTEYAYYCRCIGMVGMFSYMIFGTLLMARWADSNHWFIKWIRIFPCSAIILYPFLMQRKNTTFRISGIGMSYVFTNGLWNNLYSIYCVLVAANMLVLMISLCRNKRRQRIRIMGKRLLVCEGVIVLGMLMDTIFPMFGVEAFPGSTLGQFFGELLVYQIYWFNKKNQVDISNMSEFVYYSVETPVLIYNDRGSLNIVNKSAVEFLNLTKEYKDISLNELFEVDSNILHQRKELIKVDVRCKVNNAHCRLSINRILDKYNEVLGYIVMIDDLSDKIQIIQELEQAKLQADLANHSKSMFLAQMSHEIRTPLNTVLGMDEMILEESQEPRIKEYGEYIREAGKSLLGILNDILDMSKLETGKLRINCGHYYLSKVIRDILNLVGLKRQEKGLGFEMEIEDGMPAVLYGDSLRVKQIVTNIMNNAVKYTDKGKITLKVTWEPLEEDRVKIIFRVEDTGRGIRKEDQEKMFQPFDRLGETGNYKIEGYGLGLAITKELVTLMDGQIQVESQVGKGSVFTVSLPQKIGVESEIVANKEKNGHYEKKLQIPQGRILVVDDNTSNLIVVQELLKRTKIKVDMAKSGKDCLKMIHKKTYQLVFLDHMMPEMDGVAVLEKIRSMEDNPNTHVPIVVMTANAVIGAKEKYLETGFTDYVSKPVTYEALEEMLLEYIPKEYIEYAE